MTHFHLSIFRTFKVLIFFLKLTKFQGAVEALPSAQNVNPSADENSPQQAF